MYQPTDKTEYEIIYTENGKEYITTDNNTDLTDTIKKAMLYGQKKNIKNVKILATIKAEKIFDLDGLISKK